MEANDSSMDGGSLEIIENQIRLTRERLKAKLKILKARRKEFQSVTKLKPSDEGKVMILLGSDYFAEVTIKDAEKFVARKMKNLDVTIKEFEEKIKEAQKTAEELANLRQLEMEHMQKDNTSNDDEQLMDIQEELDEEGNIESVKINNEVQKLNDNLGSLVINDDDKKDQRSVKHSSENSIIETDDANITKSVEDGKAKSKANNNLAYGNNIEPEQKGMENEEQIRELLEDMGLIHVDSTTKPDFDKEIVLDKIKELSISDEDKSILKQACQSERETLDSNIEPLFTLKSNGATKKKEDQDKLLNVNGGTNTKPPIDKDDLLELEILAHDLEEEKLDGDECKYADDEEWEFESEEDEDDTLADEMLYGERQTFYLPDRQQYGDNGSNPNDLLREKVLELRRQSSQIVPSSSESEVKTRKVRFADKLEVNEVENISEDLKRMNMKKQNVSKFKQRRLYTTEKPKKNSFGAREQVVEGQSSDDPEAPLKDIVERSSFYGDIKPLVLSSISNIENDEHSDKLSSIKYGDQNFNKVCAVSGEIGKEQVLSDILEAIPIAPNKKHIDANQTQENLEVIKNEDDHATERVSKFKLSKAKDREQQPKSTAPVKDIEKEGNPSSTGQLAEKYIEKKPNVITTDPGSNYFSSETDLNTMAKAYNSGIYDDDIGVTGPVVTDLKHFEVLNQMLQLMPATKEPSDQKSRDNDKSPLNEANQPYLSQQDQVGDTNDDPSDLDDDPVLVDVYENSNPEADSNVEMSVLNNEVKENYYRLKEKLFAGKTESRNETEPIDSYGNSAKTSKFKASKLNFRPV